LKKEILIARLRFDSEGFDDEVEILDNYIEILGRELKLEPQQVLHRAVETEIAVSGFTTQRQGAPGLLSLLNETAVVEIGRLMAADYIVTGTVVEMSTSVVIFGRIINVETVEVESVAQFIVPKDSQMKRLVM